MKKARQTELTLDNKRFPKYKAGDRLAIVLNHVEIEVTVIAFENRTKYIEDKEGILVSITADQYIKTGLSFDSIDLMKAEHIKTAWHDSFQMVLPYSDTVMRWIGEASIVGHVDPMWPIDQLTRALEVQIVKEDAIQKAKAKFGLDPDVK